MSTAECPLPEVAAALDPFIKPRDKVAAIRQELQSHLHNAFDNNVPRMSVITMHERTIPRENRPAPALSGVRRAYWKALQAHAAAQARYDVLKTDLQNMRSPISKESTLILPSDPVNNSYIPLLRLRESLRKLQVIDLAFSEIASTGNTSSSNSVEGVARRQNGEPPIAPQTDTTPYRQGPDVDARILQLKKAVLSANRPNGDYVEERVRSSLKYGSSGVGELAGLQSALNELTGWMEAQLTLIGSAEAEVQPAPEAAMRNGRVTHEAASLEDVADLYDRYLTTRQTLIYTINNPTSLQVPHPTAIFASSSRMSKPKDVDKRATPSELLLPHITFLANAKQDEQTLIEQSAYLRRQINAAETETSRQVARMADESHLVPPGSARGKDWADAAIATSSETQAFVGAKMQVGATSTSTATNALACIREVPRIMDCLIER